MTYKPSTHGEIIAWLDNELADIEQVMRNGNVLEAEIVITFIKGGEPTITSSYQRDVDTIRPEMLDGSPID